MAEPQKTAKAAVVAESGVVTERAGSPNGSQKPQRTAIINGREFPVDHSKQDPISGVIYDFVATHRDVTAFVLNETTGLMERRKTRVTNYVKVQRPVAKPRDAAGLVDVE